MRDQVFVSYSHKDSTWLDRLKINLKPSIRAGRLTVWDDQQIAPSAIWRQEIEKALASAKVAVLMVSPDFLASDFIADHELPVLLEAARKDGVKILWVAIRYSNYRDTEIERYQAINDPQKPLDSLSSADVDKELVKICDVIKSFCPAAPIDESTLSAREGIEALIELMRNPTVQRDVATFRAVFESSSVQIDVLGRYKDLHDSLHTLQFQCYNYILETVRSARKRPEDPTIWENVYQYEPTIENIIDELNRFAHDDQFDALSGRIRGLIDNLNVLLIAVRDCDSNQIEAALRPVSMVLSILPQRINDRLDPVARAARLPHLLEALTKVGDNLNKFGIDPVRKDKFEKGVSALSDLNENLMSQIESHGKWQDIDVLLRLIEASISRDSVELELTWPDLKLRVSELCENTHESWAQVLSDDSKKLEEAISSNDPNSIRRCFQRYRSRVGYRFYQVDYALKELCGKLHRVGDPLTTVLEMT
jgi:hypothetical protein